MPIGSFFCLQNIIIRYLKLKLLLLFFLKFKKYNFHEDGNNVQNLVGKEAIARLKGLAASVRICMSTPNTDDMPTRPVALQAVKTDGKMYFFSSTDSDNSK